jgi:ribonuclease P protein subunit RPR2
MAVARALDAPFADDPDVEFGFLLHDVGKVAVPDAILWKPEPLTAKERALMEQHPVVGWDILREIDFLGEAKLVVRHHHERWDGSGYPDGLDGDRIPLAARVFAVADVLDALTTVRPYRSPSPLSEARDMIQDAAGSQFDPEVVDAFLSIPPAELERIKEQVG